MRLPNLVVGFALWGILAGGVPAVVSAASLGNVQDKIDATRDSIGRKKGTERLLTGEISAYNARIRKLEGTIGRLGARQADVQRDLDAKSVQLDRTQADLRHQRARLVKLRARLKAARAMLARRLDELYRSDRPDLVTIVLSARGFADLLEREEFLSRIAHQDRKIITLVRTARGEAVAATARLGRLERRQRTVALTIQARRDELARNRGVLVDTRAGLKGTRTDKARALASVRDTRHVLEGKLEDYEAQKAKIVAALGRVDVSGLPAQPIKGSGQLIWPVSGPITSPFCERRAWEACHPGIDIAVPSGTPVRAAAAGAVALTQSSASSGGYGNFICIAHTASLSTCYAHHASIAVSVGQRVARGQVIGSSGCTGRCYGPHLHFEVRINGAVTNPVAYL